MKIDYRDLKGKSGIYCIVNHETGKFYVGQTVNLEKRKSEHFWRLRKGTHANVHMQRAYNINPKAFEFRVIEFCDIDKLDEREIFFINQLKAMGKGYNLCEGGHSTRGRKCTDETKKKISIAKKGRMTPEDIKKRTEYLIAYNKSAIARERRSARMKSIPSWNKGRPCPEWKKKQVSEKLKDRTITEEHKQKLCELYQGEKANGAKLKESDVINMRLRFLYGESRMDIAKDYPNISPNHVYDIVKGKRWKHIANSKEELERKKYGT